MHIGSFDVLFYFMAVAIYEFVIIVKFVKTITVECVRTCISNLSIKSTMHFVSAVGT